MVLSEHAMHTAAQEAWRKKARAQGYQLYLGPADPEAAVDRARAGVGCLAPAPAVLIATRAESCCPSEPASRLTWLLGPQMNWRLLSHYVQDHCQGA